MSECLCGKKFNDGPAHVIEINERAQVPVIYKVEIPAEAGDDTANPPLVGAYRNTIVEYLANNHVYFYSSDGAYTLIATDRIDKYTISVNGKSGVVNLTAADVHALSEDTVIPDKTSQLENDAKFVDEGKLAQDLEAFRTDSDAKYADKSDLNNIPTKVSQLENDSNYVSVDILNEETEQRKLADNAIRGDMLKIKVTTVDPGEGSPLDANTLLGVYR